MTTKLLTPAQFNAVANAFSEITNIGGKTLRTIVPSQFGRLEVSVSQVTGVSIAPVNPTSSSLRYGAHERYATAYGLN